MDKQVLLDTLAYLEGQKAERQEKINAFEKAKLELEAAKEKVVSFGDMSGVFQEIERLNNLSCRIEGQINEEQDGAEIEEPQEEGVADEVVVTEAEA